LIQSVATLQKRCILRFTETTLHIICRDHLGGGSADPGGGGSGIEVWSQVKAASLFTDYRIQSNAGNEISLLLASDALLAALRAAAGADAHTVVMKLAKKHELAVLTIELTLHARLGADAVVAHDVRIEVQKPADMERLKEPLCPEPDVRMQQGPESSTVFIICRCIYCSRRSPKCGRQWSACARCPTSSRSARTTGGGCSSPSGPTASPSRSSGRP
jgi:HUS1 checkpoint protein